VAQPQPANAVVEPVAEPPQGLRRNPPQGVDLEQGQLKAGLDAGSGRIGEECLAKCLVGGQLADGSLDRWLAHRPVLSPR